MFLSLFGNPPTFTATNAQSSANFKKLTLSVSENVEITNYKDKKNKKNNIKISIFDGSVTIEKNGKKQGTADFSDETFKILRDIAKMDGNNEDITFDDLQKAKKNVAKPENVKNIKIDPNEGIVNIYDKDNKVRLHFDFETDKEKAHRTGKNEKAPTKTVDKSNEASKTTKPKKSQNTNLPKDLTVGSGKINYNSKKTKTSYNQNTKKCINDTIPEGYKKDISRTAQSAGVSEDFVKLLIFTEGQAHKGKFIYAESQYKCSANEPTIGFGHTNNTDSYTFNDTKTTKFNSKTEITQKEAFDILIADIKFHRARVIECIGESKFKSLPKSVQEGLIDLSFNAGQKWLRYSENLKANLEGGYLNGLSTTSICNEGDARRSAFRILHALKGLSEKHKNEASKFFDRNMRSEKNKDKTYKEFFKNGLTGKEREAVLKDIKNFQETYKR